MIINQIDGAWFVFDNYKTVAGPFETNELAWRWHDHHIGEPCASMPPRSSGVQDSSAVDLSQIKLIINTEMQAALSRMLPQIEAVLRESYPEIPD
jgi:hypothetical protein